MNGKSWCYRSDDVVWDFNSTTVNAPCDDGWIGLTCQCFTPTIYSVISISLESYCLSGFIPSSIQNLTYLQNITLPSNQLYGSLPTTLASLLSLEYLTLANNSISGSIPLNIDGSSSLQLIDFSNNLLSGYLPSSLGNLTNLISLAVSYNYLNGSLPHELFNATNLISLSVDNNEFTGSIPSTISKLQQVTYLGLSDNFFSGTLPPEIALPFLETLTLNENRLHGSIPGTIGNMKYLHSLFMSENLFSGSLSDEMFYATSLRYLSLDANYIVSTIPTTISNLQQLEIIYMNSNFLFGAIPFEIGYMISLKELYLYFNDLTGSIPSSIGLLSQLVVFYSQYNQLHGTIPVELFDAISLRDIQLNDNYFTGSISSQISRLGSLSLVNLHANYLTGSLPDEMSQCSKLHVFVSFYNYLTSTLPASMSSLISLNLLILNNNYLTGSIQGSLFMIPKLFSLSLAENLFTGKLPAEIGYATSLSELAIDDNAFSGPLFSLFTVDSSIALGFLSASGNLLTGSIPTEFFQLPSLSNISTATNCFTGRIPDSICNASSLFSINFDGMGSNKRCEKNENLHWFSFARGTFSVLGFHSSIPACLLSLPNLRIAHLSGNKLRHRIPEISSSSKLTDLTVSNNALTGPIPASIQRHSFVELDLSNNQLSGTLIDDFMISPQQSALSLAVNRLSGPFPQSIIDIHLYPNLTSVNILASNIFGCSNNQLPVNDQQSRSYSCGSNEHDLACIVWSAVAGFFLFLVIVFVLLLRQADQDIENTNLHPIANMVREARLLAGKWWTTASLLYSSNYQPIQEIKSHSKSSLKSIAASSAASIYIRSLTSNMRQLNQTKGFLIGLEIIYYYSYLTAIICAIILSPAYLGFDKSSSIVTFDYGYASSMAFLHGVGITSFIAVIVFMLLLVLVIYMKLMRKILDKWIIHASLFKAYNLHPAIVTRKYLLLFAVHLINLSVTLTVNAAYVSTILASSKYSRSELLLVQVALSIFKQAWNDIYIPVSCQRLAKFMSLSRSMQNRLIMQITNVVVAPCIATIVVNQSCYYYVFVPLTSVKSVIASISCINFVGCLTGTCACALYQTTNIVTTTDPAFQYSYACGTALLVSYIPVLIYSYVIYDFLVPTVMVIRQVSSDMIKRYTPPMVSKLMGGDLIDSRVQGRYVIINLCMHLSVLLTFGIASPVLGIMIVIGIAAECYTSKIFVGKSILDYSIEFVYSESFTKAENPMQVDGTEPVALEQAKPRVARSSMHASLRILENLDMQDSLCGLFRCVDVLLGTVTTFWALLFFDMVADKHSNLKGGAASIVVGIGIPIIGYTLYRCDPSIPYLKLGLHKLQGYLKRTFALYENDDFHDVEVGVEEDGTRNTGAVVMSPMADPSPATAQVIEEAEAEIDSIYAVQEEFQGSKDSMRLG
jgi:Leucine-rich repeat (LRR) protein